MNTRMILASLITAATLAACSSPITPVTPEDLGAQPTLDELNADNDSSLELSGSTGGLGNLLVRKIYDTNQNGKYDDGEQGIPDWGVRIVSVDANGNPDDAADIQVTPQGSQRWRGVNLKVPYGRYKIEELAPTGTKQVGTSWKVTGQTSRILNVSREKSVRAVEFAGVCLENGVLVKFPKIADFAAWKCRATFDLLPRIGSFTVTPAQIQAGGSSTLAWNVLDYSKLEITPTVGVVTGFTGSKSVTPSSTTAYTLKATNGFGSRTANVNANVGSSASGKWATLADVPFVAEGANAITLSGNRLIFSKDVAGVVSNLLYDFNTGASKALQQLPVYMTNPSTRVIRPSDGKFVSTINQATFDVYDPITDTLTSSPNPITATVVPVAPFQGDVFFTAQIDGFKIGKITTGLFDAAQNTYTQTAVLQATFDTPGTILGGTFLGLTKDKNALFEMLQSSVSGTVAVYEARAILVNPRTGQILSNKKMPQPLCFVSRISDFGFTSFTQVIVLGNGHLFSRDCDYDPASNTFAGLTSSGLTSKNILTSLYLLSNGQVLGMRDGRTGTPTFPFDFDDRGTLYDPSTQTVTSTSLFQQARTFPKSAQLSDGRVLLYGGFKPRDPTDPNGTAGTPFSPSSIEVYTP
jgi:hypothetical protein